MEHPLCTHGRPPAPMPRFPGIPPRKNIIGSGRHYLQGPGHPGGTDYELKELDGAVLLRCQHGRHPFTGQYAPDRLVQTWYAGDRSGAGSVANKQRRDNMRTLGQLCVISDRNLVDLPGSFAGVPVKIVVSAEGALLWMRRRSSGKPAGDGPKAAFQLGFAIGLRVLYTSEQGLRFILGRTLRLWTFWKRGPLYRTQEKEN